MQLPIITGLYAGLLGIFLCVLTAQVGILRGKLGISLYDGGDKQLGLTIRRQANLTEQAPMALIVIALVEMGVFVGILVVGWLYAWRKGALEWG